MVSGTNNASSLDWLTVIALSVMAVSLNVGLHETSHAVACLVVGAQVKVLAALYALCESSSLLDRKIVDGIAPFYNLFMAGLIWFVLPQISNHKPRLKFFLWLFMLFNGLTGTGYLMVSGIANIGDLATVIYAWQPHWFWRVLLSLVGSILFMLMIWLSLRALGGFIGGKDKAQFQRANTLSLLAYISALVFIILIGLRSPLGVSSLPVTAGIIAVLFGYSPLLWMIHWFSARHFSKAELPLLNISRHRGWLLTSAIISGFYFLVLGRGIQF